jgi:hypothetical protein
MAQSDAKTRGEPPLLHGNFEKCDECGEIVLLNGRGECLELDDAIYCPRHARGRMSEGEWQLRWGNSMEMLKEIRDDASKALKYQMLACPGSFWVVHREDQIYEAWRRCDDDRQQNFTTISESSIVRQIEQRCAGGAYDAPAHVVKIEDAPINAETPDKTYRVKSVNAGANARSTTWVKAPSRRAAEQHVRETLNRHFVESCVVRTPGEDDEVVVL